MSRRKQAAPREILDWSTIPALTSTACSLAHLAELAGPGALEQERALIARLLAPLLEQLDKRQRVMLAEVCEERHGWFTESVGAVIADTERRTLGRQVDEIFVTQPDDSVRRHQPQHEGAHTMIHNQSLISDHLAAFAAIGCGLHSFQYKHLADTENTLDADDDRGTITESIDEQKTVWRGKFIAHWRSIDDNDRRNVVNTLERDHGWSAKTLLLAMAGEYYSIPVSRAMAAEVEMIFGTESVETTAAV